MSKPRSKTEEVTLGTISLGRIHLTDRGFEAFGPRGEYVCTFTTLQAARRALFELHRDGEEGMRA